MKPDISELRAADGPPNTDDFARLNLVGESAAFKQTIGLIQRIACCDATALIQGETGTGKELAARAIHYLGPRRAFPFIPVNCGAIPDNLIENELFGHQKGAFTDAREPRRGLIAQANGGTLFLDEVDALSPKGQVTLLRFLQDLHYRPLGSAREERANLRVIAATNVDLAELVEEKQYRSDLFYRLRILALELPPLREREGDPGLLGSHFARLYSERYGGPRKTLDPDTVPVLDSYSWPGNVRELENVILRELLLAPGPQIRIPPSQLGLPGANLSARTAIRPATSPSDFGRAKACAIEEFERSFLQRALADSNGNVSLAALRCGKERRAFGKLLKKHGIDREHYSGK